MVFSRCVGYRTVAATATTVIRKVENHISCPPYAVVPAIFSKVSVKMLANINVNMYAV